MFRIGFMDSAIYKRCGEEDETAFHVFITCTALALQRQKQTFLTSDTLKEDKLKSMTFLLKPSYVTAIIKTTYKRPTINYRISKNGVFHFSALSDFVVRV